LKKNQNIHPIIQKIVDKESNHIKPATLVLFPVLFIVLIVLILLRGTSSVESVIGVKSCSVMSFVFLGALILFYIGMTIIDIILVK